MAKASKRQRANVARVDRQRRYGVEEGLELLKTMAPAKFDETVEVAIRLGVDPKKSDQMVRGVVRLPHGSGRAVRILVFAKGDKEADARAAGADHVGAEDLVQKIQGGWLEFDKAIATPDMMPQVGRIAKILGPRGLMPNPKVGTVTTDVTRAVQEEKAGRAEFRVEKAGIVHVPIGKFSFAVQQLTENLVAVIEQVAKQKPATSKGEYMPAMSIATTMGPGIKLDPAAAQSRASKE